MKILKKIINFKNKLLDNYFFILKNIVILQAIYKIYGLYSFKTSLILDFVA